MGFSFDLRVSIFFLCTSVKNMSSISSMDQDKDFLSTQISANSEVEKKIMIFLIVTAILTILSFSLQFDFFFFKWLLFQRRCV